MSNIIITDPDELAKYEPQVGDFVTELVTDTGPGTDDGYFQGQVVRVEREVPDKGPDGEEVATWPVKVEIVATVENQGSNVLGEFTIDVPIHADLHDVASRIAQGDVYGAIEDVRMTVDSDGLAAALADGLISAASEIRRGAYGRSEGS